MVFAGQVPVVAAIRPQSVAAAANVTSGWFDAGQAPNFIATVNVGALGGGTVTPSWEQAQTSTGTGVKALTNWGAGSAMATNNAEQSFENSGGTGKLDVAGGFYFVRLKLANVGGTGALVSAVIQSSTTHAS